MLQPPTFVNQYAAMPSLLVGWDLLMGFALVTWGGHRAVRLAARGDVGRTVKALGDGSRRLQEVEVGTWVVAEGPYGAMTAARRTRPPGARRVRHPSLFAYHRGDTRIRRPGSGIPHHGIAQR